MSKRFLTPISLLNSLSDPASGSDGDMYFNTISNKIRIYYSSSWHDSSNETADVIVSSGSAYPLTGLTNGQMFYNTSTGRTGIYFNSIWQEFAYYSEITSFDGGAPTTTVFGNSIDGGSPGTLVFVGSYDGGTP
jgi:hypothetical protein